MSTRSFLVCQDYAHAELVDQLVLLKWQELTGDVANSWSEVYSDGERFGIYWGAPVSDLFGYPPSPEYPEGDPSLVIVEDTEGVWKVVRPEPEAPNEGAV